MAEERQLPDTTRVANIRLLCYEDGQDAGRDRCVADARPIAAAQERAVSSAVMHLHRSTF